MTLDYGWLDLLAIAVVRARCNGAEFGIKHFDLVPKAGIDGIAFRDELITRHGITLGRFAVLKHAALWISPETITASTDEALGDHFMKLVDSGAIVLGAVTGLRSQGLADGAGRLQPKGILLLREIAAAHLRVEV